MVIWISGVVWGRREMGIYERRRRDRIWRVFEREG